MRECVRQCSICGRNYILKYGNEFYCSDTCKKINKANKNTAYRRLNKFDKESDFFIKEATRSSLPTEEDIEVALLILKDFGISNPSIPDFKSYSELEMWQKEYIAKALS